MENQQVTISQANAAQRYGVADRTIRRWEKAKLIKGKRVRGVKLYPVKDLDRLAGIR